MPELCCKKTFAASWEVSRAPATEWLEAALAPPVASASLWAG